MEIIQNFKRTYFQLQLTNFTLVIKEINPASLIDLILLFKSPAESKELLGVSTVSFLDSCASVVSCVDASKFTSRAGVITSCSF